MKKYVFYFCVLGCTLSKLYCQTYLYGSFNLNFHHPNRFSYQNDLKFMSGTSFSDAEIGVSRLLVTNEKTSKDHYLDLSFTPETKTSFQVYETHIIGCVQNRISFPLCYRYSFFPAIDINGFSIRSSFKMGGYLSFVYDASYYSLDRYPLPLIYRQPTTKQEKFLLGAIVDFMIQLSASEVGSYIIGYRHSLDISPLKRNEIIPLLASQTLYIGAMLNISKVKFQKN